MTDHSQDPPTSVQLNEEETRRLLRVLRRKPKGIPWSKKPGFVLEIPAPEPIVVPPETGKHLEDLAKAEPWSMD